MFPGSAELLSKASPPNPTPVGEGRSERLKNIIMFNDQYSMINDLK
jgi:hypothetical protein